MKYNLINFCEIDQYASVAYSAIHNEPLEKNLGNITEINIESLPKCDMITHGSPCQSFSIAGTNEGGDHGSGTRSSLMWNSVEIISHCQPKFVIWENVKNVLSKTHKHNFDRYIEKLDVLGYNSYYEVLNAKDYNVPQNRERIFVVSIKKEIDNQKFTFPQKMELQYRLKDLLEKEVDENFYITDGILNGLIEKGLNSVEAGIANNPPVHTCGGGNIEPKVMQSIENEVMLLDDTKSERFGGGKVWKDISPCLRHSRHGHKIISNDGTEYTIRKLIPLECWRLMNFDDEDFYKAQKALENTFYKGRPRSNSQMYKTAGNSIVVNVISEIYKQLQKAFPNDFKDLDLISLFSGVGAFEAGFKRI